MLESNKSKAERLFNNTSSSKRGQHFMSCLIQSNAVVAQTCKGINDYCAEWVATPTDDVVPTAAQLHPPDMLMVKRNGASNHRVEIKRDARSRDTGNIFFEAKAINEAVADGCTRMFYWVDGLGSFIYFDLPNFLIWLQNQSIYHKANAGDGKKFGGQPNSGWAIPIKKFVDGECRSAQVGPIIPLWCEARNRWVNKRYLELDDKEFQKYVEDVWNNPTTTNEKMVLDFANIFWKEHDRSWFEVSKLIKRF